MKSQYKVKLNNRQIRTKEFLNTFDSYSAVRAAVKRHIRAKGLDADKGFKTYGYSIVSY